ncbi:MAG: OsmC family protein [bacterium]
MTGTFGGALEARQVDASNGKLYSETEGEIIDEDGVLVVDRIVVDYYLTAPEEQRETIERVHEMHAEQCPVARSLEGAVEIETRLHLEDAQ